MTYLSSCVLLSALLGWLAGVPGATPQSPPAEKSGAARNPIAANSAKSVQRPQEEFDIRYAEALALLRAHDYEKAAAKFREAERLAENLGDKKYSWLQEVLAGEADCFLRLKKFSETEAALLRRKSVLQVSTGELDGSYAHNLSLLAGASVQQQNWQQAEAYLQQAFKAYDKVIDHLANSKGSADSILSERREKALDQYHLGLVYTHLQRYADALVVLDESFTAGSAAHLPSSQLTPIATTAKDIAVHTGFPSDVEKWHKRLDSLPESATVPKN